MDGGTVGDRFTEGLAGAGDVNADGYSDAVTSAPFALGGDVGGFNVLVGGAGGFSNASVPAGDTTRAGWGRVLAGAGDVNGNGRDDLLVAAPFLDSNRGRVYLVDGDALIAAGLFNFPTRFFEMSGDAQYASLGASLAGLGDTNGDGFADVAFGAPGENSDSLGKVYVLRGATTVPTTASAFMISMAGGERYGAAIGGLDSIVPDAPPTCAAGLSRCGAACVDASSNASNCGGCGRACATGQTCVAGVCTTGTTCTPGAVCRTSTGTCDVAEICTSAGACPSDAFAPSSTVCRTSAGTCDVAETCTGSSAACPSDAFLPSSTVCRAAVTASCDPAESCTGASAACPSDVSSSCTSGQRCVSGVCMTMSTCGAGTTACGASCCTSSQSCLTGSCRVLVLGAGSNTSYTGTTTGVGSPLTSACPTGMLLTEIDGIGPSPFPFPGAPVGFSSIWATCMNASLTATPSVSLTGSTSTSPSAFGRGVTGVGFPFITACPTGQAAVGLDISTDVNSVGHTVPVAMRLRCAPITVSAMGSGYVVGRATITTSPEAGTPVSSYTSADCAGSNGFASGVSGYVYDMPMSAMDPASIEALALTCASATVSP